MTEPARPDMVDGNAQDREAFDSKAFDSKAFDSIVAEVVRRLQSRTPAGSNGAAGRADAVDSTNGRETASGARVCGGALVATGPVLSLQGVERQLDGVRELVAPRGAVLTPALRDELRARGIAIRYETTVAEVSLWLGGTEPADTVEGWARALGAQPVVATKLPELAAKLSRELAAGTAAVWISRRPLAVVCAANRWPSLRAALSRSRQEADDAVREISANVLVVPWSPRPERRLQDAARALRAAGSRIPIPPELT